MPSLNQVQIIGHLGRDPENRSTPTGQTVSNFSVACTESWKDKGGEKQERTEWVRVQAWGKLAEICGEYLKKGSLVFVQGRLQTREWTDKQDVVRYTTEVVADKMVMLGGKGDKTSGQAKAPPKSKSESGTGFDEMDDDIPF